MSEITRFDMKIVYTDDGKYEAVPLVEVFESNNGKFCLARQVEVLEDEVFNLRSKHNDWD